MNRPRFKIGAGVARQAEIENSNPFTSTPIYHVVEIHGECREGERWSYQYMCRTVGGTELANFFESELASQKEAQLAEKMIQEKQMVDQPPLIRGDQVFIDSGTNTTPIIRTTGPSSGSITGRIEKTFAGLTDDEISKW